MKNGKKTLRLSSKSRPIGKTTLYGTAFAMTFTARVRKDSGENTNIRMMMMLTTKPSTFWVKPKPKSFDE